MIAEPPPANGCKPHEPCSAGLVRIVLLGFLTGTAVIFTLGVAWLTVLFGFQTAITAGVLPFVTSEAVKIALAVAVFPMAWKLAKD